MPDTPGLVMVDLSASDPGAGRRENVEALGRQLRETLLAQGATSVDLVPSMTKPGSEAPFSARYAVGGVYSAEAFGQLTTYLRSWFDADHRWRVVRMQVNEADIQQYGQSQPYGQPQPYAQPYPGYPQPYPQPAYPPQPYGQTYAQPYAGQPYGGPTGPRPAFDPMSEPPGGTGSFRVLAILGLCLLVAGGPLAALSYYLPYYSTDNSSFEPEFKNFIRVDGGELVGALIALVALILVLTRNPAARHCLALARGGASWLLASGLLIVWGMFGDRPDDAGSGYTMTVLLGLALIAGALLLQASAWRANPFLSGFPILAAVFAIAAMGEGFLYFKPLSELYGEPSYLYLLGLGLGGVLLLATRDSDPFRLPVWLGWSALGLVYIWAFGSLYTGDGYSGLTWTHLLLSSIIPVLVAVAAIVHTQMFKNRTATTRPGPAFY